MPGAMPRTRSQRTAPRRWCARRLDSEVNMIVAIEVAIAILIARASGTPFFDRMMVMKGTCIMPPPTPSMPARKPVHRPSATSSAASQGSIDISAPAGGSPHAIRRA
jgi:hypothetical protein